MPSSRIKIPPDIQAQIDALRLECQRFERKGLFDTAHHEMLRRLEKEYGAKAPEKELDNAE